MHLLQYEPLLVVLILRDASAQVAVWLQLINVHPLLFLNCHAAIIIRTYCRNCSEDATAGLEVDVPDTNAASLVTTVSTNNSILDC